MEYRKKLVILNALVTGSFWLSFGLGCSAMGKGDWMTAGNNSFGLFRKCESTCQHWSTSEADIIGSRGLLVSSIIVGFFGWNFAFAGYKSVKSAVTRISIGLFSVACILDLIGMSIWTAYFSETYAILTWNFNFAMYWASVGVTFLTIIFSVVLTFALKSSDEIGCK